MSKRQSDAENEAGSSKKARNAPPLPAQTFDVTQANLDEWEKVFDYLPLRDLQSMAHTCNQIRLIAGQYFKTQFASKSVYWMNGSIHIGTNKMNIFCEFISNLSITSTQLFNFYSLEANPFKALRTIKLSGELAASGGTEITKEIFSKLECVKLWYCRTQRDGDLYEDLLKFCPNLRTLEVRAFQSGKTIEGIKTSWLLQKYPLLQRVDFDIASSTDQIDEVKTFLELNPSLKTLKVNDQVFRTHLSLFMETDCKLDILEVDWIHDKPNFDTIRTQFNALHDRGFYKRLFFPKTNIFSSYTELSSIKGLAEIDLPDISHARTCPIRANAVAYNMKMSEMIDLNTAIESITEVNKLIVLQGGCLEFGHLMLMLGHLPRLKEIYLTSYEGSNGGLINLPALDAKRAHLNGACKVNILVREHVYLANQWQFGKEDLRFVALKRFNF